MINKIVAVTGVTGSIGKATAIELAKRGCHVILLARDTSKLTAVRDDIIKATGNKYIETVTIDLSEPKSIKRAVAEIKSKHNSINALVNVAAIFKPKREENSEGHEYMFATNHLGPFMLTNQLLDLLKKGAPARVVTVSAPSTTKINFEDIDSKQKFSSGFLGVFGATKSMNIIFTYALAEKLKGSGVTTSVFHPGLVKSKLTSKMPALMNAIIQWLSGSPGPAAKMLADLTIADKYLNSNCTFFKYNGKELSAVKYHNDKDVQERLWKLSEQLTK